MSEHCVVCTHKTEKNADEYGVRRNASFAVVDEEGEGFLGCGVLAIDDYE